MFKRLKEKKCGNLLCKGLKLILFNQITQLLIITALIILPAIGLNFTDPYSFFDTLLSILFIIGVSLAVIIAIIMIIYSIINFLKDIKRW